jgi:hypothetical protein
MSATPDGTPRKPNPGSDEALAAGCKCPVIDNNYGQIPPFPPDGWYMIVGCPVHELPRSAG